MSLFDIMMWLLLRDHYMQRFESKKCYLKFCTLISMQWLPTLKLNDMKLTMLEGRFSDTYITLIWRLPLKHKARRKDKVIWLWVSIKAKSLKL